MALPTVNIKITSGTVDETLKDLLIEKLSSLEKYIGNETDVKCDAEFSKTAANENGPIFRVEVNLLLAGQMYRAEATLNSFEAAIDEVRDELDKELRRHNKKHNTLAKKGGRKIKEMIRLGRT